MSTDPFGQAILYYTERNGRVVTAPSIWSLAKANTPLGIEARAIEDALLGRRPSSSCIYTNVRRVPPGSSLRIENGAPRIDRAWRWPEAIDCGKRRPSDAAQELLSRLTRVLVRVWPQAGAVLCLSGGLDSSGLLALLAEQELPVRAYVMRAAFIAREEIESARRLCEARGIELRYVDVSGEELCDRMEAAVCAIEEPIWNAKAVASYAFLRALAQQGEPVVLSGLGADEVFGGDARAYRRVREQEHEVAALVETLALGARGPVAIEIFDADTVLSFNERRAVMVERVLPQSTLPPECRSARALGLDLRLPFLDEDFADWALALPEQIVEWQGGGKDLWRTALRRWYSEAQVRAPKKPHLALASSSRANARRLELYDTWLAQEAVSRWADMRASRIRALFDAFSRLSALDPLYAAHDIVLMRMVSLSMLAKRLQSAAAASETSQS
ncbi:MAG: asparagine synthase-related protein [Vicinamibacteria bacterium]|jgi:asparagine synthase (glutamine-hydrolysing)|nr:asparagine synthase-related protein [Vicinamibacteria bacterium]